MYTIKEAAARTGVSVALLRAWERRYGVVAPSRTAAGYRLYDEAALDRLRVMRALLEDGWQPSAAAAAILDGTAPTPPPSQVPTQTAAPDDPDSSDVVGSGPPGGEAAGAIAALVAGAAALDSASIERALDDIFAAGSYELVAERLLLPALVEIGNAWADGRLSVAAEHAASEAVRRRLAAAFQAAGRAPSGGGVILVGLPPGSRHDIGALAFAVAARRAGLPILYLGADLPADDWVETARRTGARAVVIGAPTAADVEAASHVADALGVGLPKLVIAAGGTAAEAVAHRGGRVLVLPDGLDPAVRTLSETLAIARV